jgi:hypothetical protein
VNRIDLNDMDRFDANLGCTVFHEGERGTLRGYGPSDGLWWAIVDMDDETTTECLLSEVEVHGPHRW